MYSSPCRCIVAHVDVVDPVDVVDVVAHVDV